MESNRTFWIIMLIVTVSTLVETKSVPHRDSHAARSLLSVSPPSESPSPSPAPGPEVEKTIATPASSPIEIDIDSPSPSPGAPADSISPANAPSMSSPSPSPGAPADSISPTNAPTTSSPSPSPEAPANAPTTDSPFPSEEVEMDYPEALVDSASPANPPTEMEIDSPSPSPEGPEESLGAPSGETLVSSAKTLLKQTMLSPEIKTICSKTDNSELCESSVAPLLTAAVKPDASSVLVLAIQASINATKAAKPAVDKAAAPDCQELYDDAVANLEDAINAVNERDIATVNTNLSAAMTDYGTCNDGFEESGEPNPLADIADKLHKMVSNCLAISSLIK
ncbi:Plant invertase/pectin methylesterase inhibitor superfamily protein [Raphanus sativus]|uniref:Vegetative cell wall protein gp1-like n=1 Tax=Raphanus sativus TaxID=3726 RepID=A0A6J0JI60_RAPSA|nr:vegetative cell wall protein gp1-like [Raphanus sativus]KAJ4869655.1 Plant invertase/pectin methylesterase inhibitor superfamily protein [Raphanus sativus]